MNVEAFGEESNHPDGFRSFAHSTLMLGGWVLLLGTLFFVIASAADLQGTSGPYGIVLAAVSCLAASIAAEGVGCFVHSLGALGNLLLSMALRAALPLGVCFYLAAIGASGHEHLVFVAYLIGFYFLTLIIETKLAIDRASAARSIGA